MSKARQLLGLLATLALGALALSALAATPASAQTEPTTLNVCKEVPPGLKGLYTTGQCSTNSTSGTFAWTWPTNKGKETVYCVLGGTTYTEGLCTKTGTGALLLELTANKPFPQFEGELLLSLLASTIASTKTIIGCKAGTFAGQPLTPTLTSEVVISYSSCTVQKLPECEVKSYEPEEPTGKITTRGLDSKLLSLTSVLFTPETTNSQFANLELTGSKCSAKGTKLPVKGEQQCQIGSSPSTPALLHLIECFTSGSKLTLGTGNEKATYEGTTHVKVAEDLWWKIQ